MIFSLFLIFNPEFILGLLVASFGAIILIIGILKIVAYFRSPKEFQVFSLELIQGIVFSIIGFIFILKQDLVISLFPFVISIWVIMQSIVKLQIAFNIKATGASSWKMLMILSIITLIMGIIIICNTFLFAKLATILCGIFLLISEIINIIDSIFIMKL